MRKTLYKIEIGNRCYWIGDKVLRIVSIVLHTLELGLILYLLFK